MPASLLTNLNSAFSLRAVGIKQARRFVKSLNSSTIRHCGNRMTMAAPSGTSIAASSSELVVNSLISSSSGNASSFAKPTVFYGDKRGWSCRRACLSMRSVSDRNGASGNVSCFVFDVTLSSRRSSPVIGFWSSGGIGNVSLRRYSEGAVPDVSDDGLSTVDQLGGLAIFDEQCLKTRYVVSTYQMSRNFKSFSANNLNNVLTSREKRGDRALKLLSGSCYLPHPDKEKTGGEDAHFICTEEQVIGVADGVGGWADVGINAGLYARELMSNSVNAIRHEPKGSIDPARVLEKAHQQTTAKGSSTACIITLTEQGLHAINLGDSGFIVVRDARTIFESPTQQHSFNFTYQLENGNNSDLPSSGQVFTISVAPGDVIVAGTDGLFDNLYNNEISSTVAHAVLAGLSPDATAQKIAALARQRALDRKRQTPFATAAQEAGFHYYGGKLDDITVVVSYITS